jgi:DNA processing protein
VNPIDALVLKSLSRVGDDTVTKILRVALSRRIETLEELSKMGLQNLGLKVIPNSLRELFDSMEFNTVREPVQRQFESWRSDGIEVITLGAERYPERLLDLGKPPPFLFCKGNLNLLEKKSAIAVVGTRDNTRKGELITVRTVEEFAQRKFSIVSGLALGIDAIAHQTALDIGAPTIAVLVDLQNVSPAANRQLASDILDNEGLWVAENPPGTRIIPAFFAKRDRIQAGLSTAVFAIETSVDGGTMHAVRAALSMKRPVFVPDPKAAGYLDLEAKAISGIRHLIDSGQADAYTRESYQAIDKKLAEVAAGFGAAKQTEQLF